MSSMRSKRRPPACFARSAFSSAESAWPRCRNPFGDGAKRKTGRDMDGFGDSGLRGASSCICFRLSMISRIDHESDLTGAVERLIALDPKIAELIAVGGPPPL